MEIKVERIVRRECVNGMTFPVGTIFMRKNGAIVAWCDFEHKGKRLQVFVSENKRKWKRMYINGKLAEIVLQCHNRTEQHHAKMRKAVLKANFEGLMRHPHHSKRKGMQKSSSKYAMTEYECTKNPLHDFRHCRYVIYN